MNAKTLEAIVKHGKTLLRLFPNATEKDPVALCKKLRRVEVSLQRPILLNCNVGVPDFQMDNITGDAVNRVRVLLGLKDKQETTGLFVNRDPRGYALKFGEKWTREKGKGIYQDWGGYGIVAPDLTE